MRARGENRRALQMGTILLSGGYCQIERILLGDLDAAWGLFSTYRDNAWRFTDCTDYVLTGRLGISEAFAFDAHFRKFGTVVVVP